MKYTYYFSFVSFPHGQPVFETGTLTYDFEVVTLADIQEVQKSFRDGGKRNATILGFSLLRTEVRA